MILKKHIKKIILLILIFSLISSTFPSIPTIEPTINDIVQDDVDGFWQLTSFNDDLLENNEWDIDDNCSISNGNLQLKQKIEEGAGNTYDFSQNNHDVYASNRINFFQFLWPSIYQTLPENYNQRKTVIFRSLRNPDNDLFTNHETDGPRNQIHYYRFKIEESIESISKIEISWRGKSNNDIIIKTFYWHPFSQQYPSYIGIWNRATSGRSDDSFIWLNTSLIGTDYPIADGYLHVCFVAVPDRTENNGVCTISTDYVKVEVFSTESGVYYEQGVTLSEPITKTDENATWEYFSWQQKKLRDVNVRYQLLYQNKTGDFIPVENTYIPGNIPYFTSASTVNPYKSLHAIPINYTTLKIKTTLFASNNDKDTPIIQGWGITWQNNKTIWGDYFNSSPPLRVDREDSVNVLFNDNRVFVNPIVNTWPMFGQNPSNTRTTTAIPPDEFRVEWFYFATESPHHQVGGTYQNPVLGNYIYIPTTTGDFIYRFNPLADQSEGFQEPTKKVSIPNDYVVLNTPAIGFIDNEDVVILATGNDHSNPVDGGWKNKIYAFDSFNNMGVTESNEEDPLWIFESSDLDSTSDDISYASSPVISEEDMIYITSWSGTQTGSPFSYRNNKIIALDMETGSLEWHEDLPGPSFCSPVLASNLVIVGCENANGPSIQAYHKITGGDNNGNPQWEQNVGPIGRASLVATDDMVIAISSIGTLFQPKILVSALDVTNDGSILWEYNITLSPSLNLFSSPGSFTPALFNDELYIATVDGQLHKLTITEDSFSVEWQKSYAGSLSLFSSSPAYANGNIYIGTSQDGLCAFDGTNGNLLWKSAVNQDEHIVTSPIIGDGFLYYADDNGNLNCVGDARVETEIEGQIISTPIKLPTPSDQYMWDEFFADISSVSGGDIAFTVLYHNTEKSITSGDDLIFLNEVQPKPESIQLQADFSSEDSNSISYLLDWQVTFIKNGTSIPQFSNFNKISEIPLVCSIDVQDSNGLINTSAKFILRYDNETMENLQYSQNITTAFPNNTTEKQTLEVNVSTLTFLKDSNETMRISRNITDLEIQFSIRNVNNTRKKSEWYSLLAPKDEEKPIFYLDSFTPENNYIASLTPVITIQAKDVGTDGNISGINVDSAQFEIRYTDNQGTDTELFDAACTGSNGTQNIVTLTADISSLPFSENITNLYRIRFHIADMAGNENSTSWFTLDIDDVEPSSEITNANEIGTFVNTTPVEIKVNASDALSGIKNVGLYYRKTDQTQWTLFDSMKTEPPYRWNFTVGPSDGGEYELISIATDNAGNEESQPTTADIVFVFDPNPPSKPIFSSLYEFTNEDIVTTGLPSFSDVIFEDDYRLESVSYRLNFEGTNEWTQINPTIINEDTYQPTWNLTQEQWDTMQEDIIYSIYFKVTDVVGNTYETPDSSDAMKVQKNFKSDNITFTPDFSDFDDWSWNNQYEISVDINTTDYQSLILWYSFSETNTTNHSWKPYGENLSQSRTSWDFTADEGNGYYSFQIQLIDNQGNTYTSEVNTIYISMFPLLELIVFIVLSLILIALSIVFFQKRRRKTIL